MFSQNIKWWWVGILLSRIKHFFKCAICFGFVLPALFFFPCSADISTVRYAHDAVYQLKNITVPINAGLDPSEIHSMEYLMRLIDNANLIMNGFASTNYANSAIANTNLVDTYRTLRDIDELVTESPYFQLVITNESVFRIKISATGNFTVDWGDGKIQNITRSSTTLETYSHTYESKGTYNIRLFGKATGYSTNDFYPSISFESSYNLISISGSLGKLFPTLPNGAQPRFVSTFGSCYRLTNIPEDLFSGISGPPIKNMFSSTFYGCEGLTSIPANLFAQIQGPPAATMFNGTFSGCIGLTSLPEGLFAGISGPPAISMFSQTFQGCEGLTGSIPSNLFGNIDGPPAISMFSSTFSNCSRLTGSIPAGLFGRYHGSPQSQMFYGTFYGCANLTGIEDGIWDLTEVTNEPVSGVFNMLFYNCGNITSPSPSIAAGNPTRIWQHFSNSNSSNVFRFAYQLADFSSIPSSWK